MLLRPCYAMRGTELGYYATARFDRRMGSDGETNPAQVICALFRLDLGWILDAFRLGSRCFCAISAPRGAICGAICALCHTMGHRYCI
eukprot:2394159-Rhodomonas_salina.2